MRPAVIYGLAGLWLIAFLGAFVAFQVTEPTGDSFTRGLNRVSSFLGWQIVAVFASVACAIATHGTDKEAKPWLRRVGYAPLVVSGVLLVGLVILVATLMVIGNR